jgi:FMN-dependent NADH-azoreductase
MAFATRSRPASPAKMGKNFAYLMATNAGISDIDAIVIEGHDAHTNSARAKTPLKFVSPDGARHR